MKPPTTVISYSLTGNNDALATRLAAALRARHLKVVESKRRSIGRIALDMLFHRTPKVPIDIEDVDSAGPVIFVGPVWMGQVAAPLRAWFRALNGRLHRYAFVSISGGADGPNPKLARELTKRLGTAPATVIDLHIADLLPSDPKPTRDDTSSYRVTDEDVEQLVAQAENELRRVGITN